MAIFLLVQPAWMGGWCWKKVAAKLRASGHDVFAPTLTGLGERAHLATRDTDVNTHVEDIVSVTEFEDLRDLVLVGTSSSGVVITGVAARVPERLASLVYLDAFLPSDGQCILDLQPAERREALEQLVATEGDGWLLPRFAPPPWPVILQSMWQVTDQADLKWMLPRLRPTPFKHFSTPVSALTQADTFARVYIRCTRTPLPPPSPFDVAADYAQATPGWRHIAIDLPHVPYVTHPGETTEVLLDAATAH